MATNEQDDELDKFIAEHFEDIPFTFCDFKEEQDSRRCQWCGETAGSLRHVLYGLIKSAIAHHTKEAVEAGVRAKMVELRDQWGVWLDDSADDKQTIREIYDWLNREIGWYDKELSAPQQSTSPDGSAE